MENLSAECAADSNFDADTRFTTSRTARCSEHTRQLLGQRYYSVVKKMQNNNNYNRLFFYLNYSSFERRKLVQMFLSCCNLRRAKMSLWRRSWGLPSEQFSFPLWHMKLSRRFLLRQYYSCSPIGKPSLPKRILTSSAPTIRCIRTPRRKSVVSSNTNKFSVICEVEWMQRWPVSSVTSAGLSQFPHGLTVQEKLPPHRNTSPRKPVLEAASWNLKNSLSPLGSTRTPLLKVLWNICCLLKTIKVKRLFVGS